MSLPPYPRGVEIESICCNIKFRLNDGNCQESVENTLGPEENAGYQHLLFFPQDFQMAFSSVSLKLVYFLQNVNIVSFFLFAS